LAAADLDAHLLGGLGQIVQGPVGGLGLVEDLRWQSIVADQHPGRLFGDKSDDPGALVLRDARFASGSGAISETIYTFGVEAMEALSYGFRMTAKLLGDCGGAQPLPAQRDDAGAEDPVARSVAAAGEFVDLASSSASSGARA
jgi:hypothetical protein